MSVRVTAVQNESLIDSTANLRETGMQSEVTAGAQDAKLRATGVEGEAVSGAEGMLRVTGVAVEDIIDAKYIDVTQIVDEVAANGEANLVLDGMWMEVIADAVPLRLPVVVSFCST